MANPGIHQLFVYGSLRSGFQSPAYEYISSYFTLVAPGRVKGILYDMKDYAAGVPTTADRYIIGELYSIKKAEEFSWAMAQLDDYEGITVEAGEQQLFRRDMVEVFLGDGVTHAWVYWYNGETTGRDVIESGDVLQYIEQKKHQAE